MLSRFFKNHSANKTTINDLPAEMLQHIFSYLTTYQDINAAKRVHSTWYAWATYKNLNLAEPAIAYIQSAKDGLKKHYKNHSYWLNQSELDDYLQSCDDSIKQNQNNAIVIANNMHRFYRKENEDKDNNVMAWLNFFLAAGVRAVGFAFLLGFVLMIFLEYLAKDNENGDKNFYDLAKSHHGQMTDTVLLIISIAMATASALMGIIFESFYNMDRKIDDLERRYQHTIRVKM